MFSIKDSIDTAKALGNSVRVGSGASPEAIARLEQSVGFSLPASYKHFLQAWGWLSIGDDRISGIADEDPVTESSSGLFGATQLMRQALREEYDVPGYLWVINRHEDGAFCFNTQLATGADELAVINYEPYAQVESFSEVLAHSFDEFLHNWYFPAYIDETDD